MYRILLSVFLFAGLSLTAHGQTDQNEPCEIRKPSKEVRSAIRGWFEESEISRYWTGAAELKAMLDDPERTCRDQTELSHAFYVLDLRDRASSSSIASAEAILNNPEGFDPAHRGEAVLYLVGAYKIEKRYSDLVQLAQRPIVKEHSYTLIPARDAYILSSFVLRGPEQTLEMLRPLANEPVNVQDWWLMHFAHAIAERTGEAELAETFLKKADQLFVPKRTMELPSDLEGDKAEKMLTEASSRNPEEVRNWILSRHPKPDYPGTALGRGQSGFCTVVFDISVEGKPENVQPYCSSKLFLNSARRAVKRVRFENIGETPQPVQDVTYPLEYSIVG